MFEYLVIGGTRLSESDKLTAIVVAPYYIIFLLLLYIRYTLGISYTFEKSNYNNICKTKRLQYIIYFNIYNYR